MHMNPLLKIESPEIRAHSLAFGRIDDMSEA